MKCISKKSIEDLLFRFKLHKWHENIPIFGVGCAFYRDGEELNFHIFYPDLNSEHKTRSLHDCSKPIRINGFISCDPFLNGSEKELETLLVGETLERLEFWCRMNNVDLSFAKILYDWKNKEGREENREKIKEFIKTQHDLQINNIVNTLLLF